MADAVSPRLVSGSAGRHQWSRTLDDFVVQWMRTRAQHYRDLASQEGDEKIVAQLKKLASALDQNADAREKQSA